MCFGQAIRTRPYLHLANRQRFDFSPFTADQRDQWRHPRSDTAPLGRLGATGAHWLWHVTIASEQSSILAIAARSLRTICQVIRGTRRTATGPAIRQAGDVSSSWAN